MQHFNCYFHHKQHFVHSQQLTRRAVWESIKKKRLLPYLGRFYSFWFKELEMKVTFTHVFIQTMEVVFVFTQLLNVSNESNFWWRQSQILKDFPDPLWHNFNPTQNNSQKHKNQLPVGILKTEKWKDIRQRDFFFARPMRCQLPSQQPCSWPSARPVGLERCHCHSKHPWAYQTP